MLSSLLALTFATHAALAAPGTRHTVTDHGDAVVIDLAWRDRKRRRRDATVLLPSADVEAARRVPARAPLRKAAVSAAKAVEARFDGDDGVTVSARARNNGELVFTAKGHDMASINRALHDAEVYGDAQMEAYLRAHGYRTFAGDVVGPDHDAAIRDAAPHLQDLARSLGDPRGDRRRYANQVLAFVQSIPYEGTRTSPDTWKPPLAVLADHEGDCDSKVTLFLAIMRAAYPKMDMAVVHVPGHALAAIDVEVGDKDATVGRGERRLVLVEPVGPDLARVGWVEKRSQRAVAKKRKHTVRRVQTTTRAQLAADELALDKVHLAAW